MCALDGRVTAKPLRVVAARRSYNMAESDCQSRRHFKKKKKKAISTHCGFFFKDNCNLCMSETSKFVASRLVLQNPALKWLLQTVNTSVRLTVGNFNSHVVHWTPLSRKKKQRCAIGLSKTTTKCCTHFSSVSVYWTVTISALWASLFSVFWKGKEEKQFL